MTLWADEGQDDTWHSTGHTTTTGPLGRFRFRGDTPAASGLLAWRAEALATDGNYTWTSDPVNVTVEETTPSESFSWEVSTYYSLGSYVEVNITEGTLPAGDYEGTKLGFESSPVDPTVSACNEISDHPAPYIWTCPGGRLYAVGGEFSLLIEGPYGITISASGTGAAQGAERSVVDSGVVNFTR